MDAYSMPGTILYPGEIKDMIPVLRELNSKWDDRYLNRSFQQNMIKVT